MYCLGTQCGTNGPYGNGRSENDIATAGTLVLGMVSKLYLLQEPADLREIRIDRRLLVALL